MRAVHVPLDLGVIVEIEPEYFREDVESAVRDALSNRRLSDGGLGLFHPDRLSAGAGVHIGAIVTEIQKLAGVRTVDVVKLQRLYGGPQGELERGVLEVGPCEIARLDNEPSLPRGGRLNVEVRGGRTSPPSKLTS